jgi:hypothetical protein
MKYDYAVVRYVPDTFRGEFVNIAVIVGSESSGEWEIRMAGNPSHARRLDNGKGLEAVWAYINSTEDLIERSAADGPESSINPIQLNRAWLEDECRRLRNLVQITPPSAVMAESASDAIEKLFDVFVVDSEKLSRRTRVAAVTAIREAYDLASPQLTGLVHEKVKAVIGKQQTTIDFAVANGHLVQLAHAWSFQTREPANTVQQIKAWSWTMRDLREYGGTVHIRNRHSYKIERDVDVDIVYVGPETDDGRRCLDEALEVFAHLHVKAVDTNNVSTVVDDALQALSGK